MSQTRGWRCALALAGIAALTTCTNDREGPPSRNPTDVPVQAVTSLPNEYNLIDNQSVNVNGATWNQAQHAKVGTGLIDPFLSIHHDGSEQGFNNDLQQKDEQFDQSSADTRSLPLNQIPVIKISGTEYREFILDANESNSPPDAQFSIDRFDVWLCDDANAPTFATLSPENLANCTKVYDLGALGGQAAIALASDALSQGSGNDFDYQILIPNSFFDATGFAKLPSCGYAGPEAASCGLYLILDTEMGAKGGDYVTGGGFEEIAIIERPFVTVTKTAVPSFTRTYNWTIQKSVSPDKITLFDGQSSTATWSITVSPGDPVYVDAAASVTGGITITNPGSSPVTIQSIADAIPGFDAVTLVCPNGTSNISVAAGGSYTCTYSVSAPNTNAGLQTNTATAEILADPTDQTVSLVFNGTATFDFANATRTDVDQNPNVYDNYNGEGEVLQGAASKAPYSYTKTYACADNAGSFSNTARLDLTGRTDPTATASLTVNCLDLTVAKTANTALTRTYLWTLAKSAQPATWNLFRGDQGTSEYTVTVMPADPAFTDANWSVSGTITITNSNAVPVYLTGVKDLVTPDNTTASVSCPGTSFPTQYELASQSSLECTYTATLSDGSAGRSNTATVTALPTPQGTAKDFTGQAVVDFTGVTLTEVNKTVHVTDSYSGGPQDQSVSYPDGAMFKYDRLFTCDKDEGTHDNTATITETDPDLQANASVTVTCYSVTVTKTANTSFDRDWNWTIDKSADVQGPLTLSPGQPYLVKYSIEVTKVGPTDDNYQVQGTITVANNHPDRGADLNGISDVVDGAGSASVTDCQVGGSPVTFPFTLDAKATLVCQYSRNLDDNAQRLNTATVTQQNHSYDKDLKATLPDPGTTSWLGTADVIFAATPTNETDECATVTDPQGGPLNDNLCASQALQYQRDIGSARNCGPYVVDNTATLTPNDNQTPQTSSVSISVDVPCQQGCTLTLGYWKTHNASFQGGAPPDDNWNNLTPLANQVDPAPSAELSGFFTTVNSYPLTGPNNIATPVTWFSVFWTAPKGNAYYNLAQQYMAAKLNILNGASAPSSVTAAVATAEDLFGDGGTFGPYVPSDLLGVKGSYTVRQQFITLAGTLGLYNEGSIGPGHCSEDGTSTLQ